MSYIYEALKRAEEEHRRRAVTVRGAARRAVLGERPRWWIWMLLGVLGANVVVVAVLVFTLGGRSPAERAPASEPRVASVPAAPVVASAPIADPVEPLRPAMVEPPAPRVEPERRTEPPRRVEPARAARARDAAPPIAPRIEPQPPASATPRRSDARSEEAAPAEPAVPVQPPQIALQVVVYSEVPSQRMVFIDGRRYGEGDALDPETVVERINPDAVVIKRRGVRFVIDARRN